MAVIDVVVAAVISPTISSDTELLIRLATAAMMRNITRQPIVAAAACSQGRVSGMGNIRPARITTATARLAPELRPSTSGPASGFRKMDCIINPLTARPPPTNRQVTALGKRRIQTIEVAGSAPGWTSTASEEAMLIGLLPTATFSRNSTSNPARLNRKKSFWDLMIVMKGQSCPFSVRFPLWAKRAEKHGPRSLYVLVYQKVN